ncbi:MAG TPA: 30S ribosomal protein S20 [Oceanospirillales bacterium]|nr:30S ribosomal protein S20 [Oceanospirillales bacterium]
MANSSSAKKRVRQAAKRRIHNMGIRSEARTHIKNVIKAIEAGDKKQAQALYVKMVPIVDKVVNKGIFHKNKIARHKSRLNNKIKAMS